MELSIIGETEGTGNDVGIVMVVVVDRVGCVVVVGGGGGSGIATLGTKVPILPPADPSRPSWWGVMVG